MKYLLIFLALFVSNASIAGLGETGSKVDSFKVLIDVALKNSSGAWVTIYSGNEYLETVGSGTGTVDSIEITKPPIDTYTDLRITLKSLLTKAKVVVGGITYYTQDQTISAQLTPFSMSTNSPDYGTITENATEVSELSLPTPLIVTSDKDVNIVWLSKTTDLVKFDDNNIQNTAWIGRDSIYQTLLTEIPAKAIQIPITYTKTDSSVLENTATFFVDNNGNLIGGDCSRPNNSAINCSMLKSGVLSGILNNGASGTFNLEYWDGDRNGFFTFSGSYDCTTSSFSSLTITNSGTVHKNYGGNDTLSTNGIATCQDI